MNADTYPIRETVLSFPNVTTALGGAVKARIRTRFAWITLPDGGEVRVPVSDLPRRRDDWTAFNLADAACVARQKKGGAS